MPIVGRRKDKEETKEGSGPVRPPGRARHILIENVRPVVDGGRYAAKRVAGSVVKIEADIFRDGNDIVRAAVKWRRAVEKKFEEAPLALTENDHWKGTFTVPENTRYVYTIEAWTDRFASWQADFKKRVDAGQNAIGKHGSEQIEGLLLVEKALAAANGRDADVIKSSLKKLKNAADGPKALAVVADDELLEIMSRLDGREDAVTYQPELSLVVDRPRAVFGAWYEMFVRTSFADAENRLNDIKAMGFDVVYLAPFHPIGTTARKGKNNALEAGPGDPGSPWAIGNEQGGHTAVDPALGTLRDFGHFVEAAREQGLETAMDFAIQCSPDHPWVKEHPEWFHQRPDGTIKYAENPPKKYEDIYPLNFDCAEHKALWEEIKNVLLFWISHGVKIFRVDNPHTKPFVFWQWLIEEIQTYHPEVIFLSEAFTRPKIMKALAKGGFTQSYTYFTWRNTKAELAEYLTELTSSGMQEYFRPNFFTNTPDILHEFLQKGGRPAFKIRLLLAATLSPSYGIYSGFELIEKEAIPGTEEYVDSEKYQVKARDWSQPGHIKDLIAKVNAIRHENAAFQSLGPLKFLTTDNEHILAYAKTSVDKSNVCLVVVNLDPANVQQGWVTVSLPDIDVRPGGAFAVCDLLTGAVFNWSERNYVRLDPQGEPAHILRLERRF